MRRDLDEHVQHLDRLFLLDIELVGEFFRDLLALYRIDCDHFLEIRLNSTG